MLITLMDKAEVGPQIVDDILLDVVRALCDIYKVADRIAASGTRRRTFSQDSMSDGQQRHASPFEELHRTAKIFFEQLEPGYIWEYLAQAFGRFEKEVPVVNSPPSSGHPLSRQSGALVTGKSLPLDSAAASAEFEGLTELSSFMLSFMPLVRPLLLCWLGVMRTLISPVCQHRLTTSAKLQSIFFACCCNFKVAVVLVVVVVVVAVVLVIVFNAVCSC